MKSKTIGTVVLFVGFVALFAGAIEGVKHPEIWIPAVVGGLAIFIGEKMRAGDNVVTLTQNEAGSIVSRLESAVTKDEAWLRGEVKAIAQDIKTKL